MNTTQDKNFKLQAILRPLSPKGIEIARVFIFGEKNKEYSNVLKSMDKYVLMHSLTSRLTELCEKHNMPNHVGLFKLYTEQFDEDDFWMVRATASSDYTKVDIDEIVKIADSSCSDQDLFEIKFEIKDDDCIKADINKTVKVDDRKDTECKKDNVIPFPKKNNVHNMTSSNIKFDQSELALVEKLPDTQYIVWCIMATLYHYTNSNDPSDEVITFTQYKGIVRLDVDDDRFDEIPCNHTFQTIIYCLLYPETKNIKELVKLVYEKSNDGSYDKIKIVDTKNCNITIPITEKLSEQMLHVMDYIDNYEGLIPMLSDHSWDF